MSESSETVSTHTETESRLFDDIPPLSRKPFWIYNGVATASLISLVAFPESTGIKYDILIVLLFISITATMTLFYSLRIMDLGFSVKRSLYCAFLSHLFLSVCLIHSSTVGQWEFGPVFYPSVERIMHLRQHAYSVAIAGLSLAVGGMVVAGLLPSSQGKKPTLGVKNTFRAIAVISILSPFATYGLLEDSSRKWALEYHAKKEAMTSEFPKIESVR